MVAAGNAGLSFVLESFADKKLQWINHTHEVIIKTEHFLSRMQDAETGQRGFLITENDSYLEPYNRGVISAHSQLDTLKQLTSDNSEQLQRIKQIRELMQIKFDELERTISLTKQMQKDKAIEIVKLDSGKKIMDEIRVIVTSFKNAELLLLEKRRGDFREHKARITTFISFEIVCFIFFAILLFTFLNRQLFAPLTLLLSSTQKMDSGEKVDVTDIVPKDEIGFLLTSFFKMNEKVYDRTQKLDHLAHHDNLTGLENRTKLSQKIIDGIAEAKDDDSKFTVLFIDLDKFKQLNDTMGHDAGDIVLKETALRLKNTVRAEDDVFRQGGDEFIILIHNITEVSQIQNIISNINKSFREPVMIQGKAVEIVLSIGIAISPDDSIESTELLKYSDIAMYYAKRNDESNFSFFNKRMLKRLGD